MITLSVLLLVIGLVCFAVAIVWNPPRVNLVAAGLACWLLATLLQGGVVRPA